MSKSKAEILAEVKDLAGKLSFAVEDFAVVADAFGRECVTFTTLHMPMDGSDEPMHACSWAMSPGDALRYLTGFVDGANWFVQLQQTTGEHE